MKVRSFLLLFFVIVLLFFGCNRAKVEVEKAQQLKALKEVSVPVRFKINERTNGKISGEIQFYSMIMDDIDNFDMEYRIKDDGELISSQTFDLEGTEFNIDFLKYKEKQELFAHEVFWVFPFRIYTDHTTAAQGTAIYSSYNRNNFPAVYEAHNLDDTVKQKLSEHYLDIMKYGDLMDDELKQRITGNAVHDMKKFASFQLNRWYDVAVHTKTGNIEYVKE
ncbi:hypothetical protein AGMMS50293_29630 [Spirochaetia bacterium]|nr:hypothetical protein AGMMS50293_29630 [Spirochaetia bacterium]